MSIAENHGGLYGNLKLLRETNGPGRMQPVQSYGIRLHLRGHGNDVGELIEAFQSVKDSKKPVVVHINTLKGKGLCTGRAEQRSMALQRTNSYRDR